MNISSYLLFISAFLTNQLGLFLICSLSNMETWLRISYSNCPILYGQVFLPIKLESLLANYWKQLHAQFYFSKYHSVEYCK